MAVGFSLKDHLFNADTVQHLGDLFESAGIFDAAPFVADVIPRMLPLELKARINLIAEVLAEYLPDDFVLAADAIERALPPPLNPDAEDDDFGHFIYAPLGVYVENHGLKKHRERSLDLLAELTQRFSMEFSIRAFLNHWQAETLARMHDWARHDNYHVRRLVSEGTRPRLPWGKSVKLTPDDTLPLLDILHNDPTRFVTRSVANHLNDITKIDSERVLGRLAAWRKTGQQNDRELAWMARHSLRNLIKAGHPGAMAHLGYNTDVDVHLSALAITPATFARGDVAQIELTLLAKTDTPLIVDYIIDFIKANGTISPKVFKLKVLQSKANVPLTLKKRHRFKADATTFALHPGAHRLHVQVNGRVIGSADFALT